MNECYYLYALTWADCPHADFGPGVDPRHAVELIRHGQLGALASRVGLDQFDLAKLQQGSADLAWLSKVAVRHHEIVRGLAQDLPVLPLRLCTLFESRSSLIARLAPHEAAAAELLRCLADRQEWAAKIYLDEDSAERAVLADHAPPRPPGPLAAYLPVRPYGRVDPPHVAATGGGTEYLVARKLKRQSHQRMETMVKQSVLAVEARLRDLTDAWRRLRPLPNSLANRPEKMVWNAAFLLARPAVASFQAACGRLASQLAPKGLSLEATGPWPAYDFCPSFEAQDEPCHAASLAGHIAQ